MSDKYNDPRFKPFKEFVEEYGIKLDDFFDMYIEFVELNDDIKTDLLSEYV